MGCELGRFTHGRRIRLSLPVRTAFERTTRSAANADVCNDGAGALAGGACPHEQERAGLPLAPAVRFSTPGDGARDARQLAVASWRWAAGREGAETGPVARLLGIPTGGRRDLAADVRAGGDWVAEAVEKVVMCTRASRIAAVNPRARSVPPE